MAEIHIIRKVGTSESNGRLSKVEKEDIRKRIGIISRVDRPAMLDMFLGGSTQKDIGGFFSLPPATQAQVKNPASLPLGEISGWQVPESDLGRKGEATNSQAESIRLWVTKHIVGNGVINADEVAVIYVP